MSDFIRARAIEALHELNKTIELISARFLSDHHLAVVLLKLFYFAIEDANNTCDRYTFAVETNKNDKNQIVTITEKGSAGNKYSFILITKGYDGFFGEISFNLDEILKIENNKYAALVNIDNVSYKEDDGSTGYDSWPPMRIKPIRFH